MNTREPAFGYMSEKEAIFDLCERGCKKLMRSGGGALSAPTKERPANHFITPEDKALMLSLIDEGKSIKEISVALKRPYMTIARSTRAHRRKTTIVTKAWGTTKRKRYD